MIKFSDYFSEDLKKNQVELQLASKLSFLKKKNTGVSSLTELN